jgi:hypothetical protein
MTSSHGGIPMGNRLLPPEVNGGSIATALGDSTGEF